MEQGEPRNATGSPGQEPGRGASFLRVLLLAGSVPALLAPLVPAVLHAVSPPFPGKWVATAGLTLAFGEKVWAMFARMPGRLLRPAQGDWTAVTVLYANVAVGYIALLDFYLWVQWVSWLLAGVSSAAIAAAAGLRHWALGTLGNQWNVHVDTTQGERSLVTSGPYRLLRHPMYLAACVETPALAVALCSPVALLCALIVFVPAEVHRAYFEEGQLRRLFGESYNEYARRTWGFLPAGSLWRGSAGSPVDGGGDGRRA
jgi:protein-S-isoprenylcysteine O-methyltransferase Ste14